ncbi:hypothetical protein V3C99_006446, partial [Haemonchus contortus]
MWTYGPTTPPYPASPPPPPPPPPPSTPSAQMAPLPSPPIVIQVTSPAQGQVSEGSASGASRKNRSWNQPAISWRGCVPRKGNSPSAPGTQCRVEKRAQR